MTKIEKLVQKFLKHPDSVRYPQIQKILLVLGFEHIPIKGSSHQKFKHRALENDIVIPVHNNDCKTFYKKQVAKIITDRKLY